MKGSPLLRALAAFFFIALAGIPLRNLTRADAVAAAPVQSAVASAQIPIALTFSVAPKKFEMLHLGKVIWSDDSHATDFAKTVAIPFPKEGVDFQIRVTWPVENADAALRVKLTDPNGDEHEKTVWGRGEMEEVVTFP